jgi:hypothetical protein
MQFPNLEQLYGGNSIFGGLLGLDQHNMAMDQAQMGQAKSLQDMFQSFQKHPLEMEGMSLGNQTTEARLPGIQAESTMAGQKAQMQTELMPELTKAERSKLLGEVDTNEFKKFQTMIEKQAMQGDPQAMQMLRRTKDVLAEIEKQRAMMDRQVAIEKIKTDRSAALQSARSEAALALQKAKQDAIATKDPKKLEAVAATLLSQALNEKDPERKAMLQEMYNIAQQQAYEYNINIRAAGATGQPDIAAATQGRVPTMQPRPAPQLTPGVSLPQNPATMRPTAQPKTQAEYDALPSGTIYVDQDGQTKRKK